MRHSLRFPALFLTGLVLAFGFGGSPASAELALMAEAAPVAVSPGDASRIAQVESRCPTFSWGVVGGASGYELVVYRLGDEGEEAQPVLRQTFAGTASSWTPSLDRGLERGDRYGWSVRAVSEESATEWSPPSLFEVAAGPSETEFDEAVEVVRQYLKQEDSGRTAAGPSSASGPVTAVPPTAGIVGPTPLSLVRAGDANLQVNGSPVLTEATLGASCLGRRWLDQGNGTVLDCNTRLIWLKDASCLGFGTWGSVFSQGTVQKAVGLLNTGLSIFNCTDYTDGTYDDWRVPGVEELCSAGAIEQNCPVANYATSLVDTRFAGSPRVSNAAGDGIWAKDDPFVRVRGGYYWSATENAADVAWTVNLAVGNVLDYSKDANFYVWPVRSRQ